MRRLDLFKKTLALPQTSMGFLQKKSATSRVLQARNVLSSMKTTGTHQTQLALIQFSLKAKAVDFSKVLAQNFVALPALLEEGVETCGQCFVAQCEP